MTAVERMLLSLQGLSVGDAFGENFFDYPETIRHLLESHDPPSSPWPYTDDTEMALSIVDVLRRQGRLDPDALAEGFARRHDPRRSYGTGADALLSKLRAGASWRQEAPAMFGGSGSFGNGAAMRVAPLGAYFADDLEAAQENAAVSAQPTHAHPEGAAGAIAVAMAAGLAWRVGCGETITPEPFLRHIAELVPDSETRAGIVTAAGQRFEISPARTAAGKPFDIAPAQTAALLGSGKRVSAQDTVPFALWCAARHLDNYEDALWATASGLGDVDTTCAIVGGIVALSAREKGIRCAWLEAREPLPAGFE